MPRTVSGFFLVMMVVLAAPLAAQDHEVGGCGDVFGDLIHLVRDDITGQPILARRFVELPKEVPGYGWGYCKIAITEDLQEIPFLPFSCDLKLDEDGDGVAEYAPVPVDYFGRLSGGRTKEKNHRMHLDEVISTIKMAGAVTTEPSTGRLMMGFDCETDADLTIFESGFESGDLSEWDKALLRADSIEAELCNEWRVVDSPMESMALYTRLMKYGHLQTDPAEIDIWSHSDPKLVPPFHPSLDPYDWRKFDASLWHLLPGGTGRPSYCFTDDYPIGGNGLYDAPEAFEDANQSGYYEYGERFDDANENGVWDRGDTFNPTCADPPEPLGDEDFIRAGSFLGGAANKFGKITVDLTQYMNRILKIPLDTLTTAATANVLPALVLDCEDPSVVYEPPQEGEEPIDPAYLDPEGCTIYEAHDGLDNYLDFPDVQEMFVDFGVLGEEPYHRSDWRGERFDQLILPDSSEGDEPTAWYLTQDVDLMEWLEIANGPAPSQGAGDIDGFAAAASDALRAIEFIHNYEVPVYLPFELP